MRAMVWVALVVVGCGGGGDDDGVTEPTDAAVDGDGDGDEDGPTEIDAPAGPGPMLGDCPLLPATHVFNTRIDGLPVHAQSGAFITTIGGTRRIHLDLGQDTDPTSDEYYGIPFNVVDGSSFTWPAVAYLSTDPDLDWNPRAESDCARTAAHTFTQPCTAGAAPAPLLPIPANPLVEGGVNPATNQMPYGDHHILIVDTDTCWLWETYHSYSPTPGVWNIYGSAGFDLAANDLRPADWSSADAAGFPILPLLLRADEAAGGTINHALRFTIQSNKIRTSYAWPARHLTSNGTASLDLPPMGQLFRLKASFVIPPNTTAQSRAIMTALKQYGMYLADGGSDMYIQGDPSAAWADSTFSQLQAIPASDFEAVDLAPFMNRAGFDPDSGAVPPP